MKKHLFTLALMTMFAATPALSQEYLLPDGVFTLELQANPFSNDFNTFKMGQLKGRFFFDERNVFRFSVGVGMDQDKNDNNNSYDSRTTSSETSYTISNGTTTTKTKQTELKLALGYEYHFAQTGRLDFYTGFEAGIDAKFFSGEKNTATTNTQVNTTRSQITTSSSNFEYKEMLPDGSKKNERTIFGNVFTGLDFYVYKGLYIGTELGLSFQMGKQFNGSYTKTENRTRVVDNQTIENVTTGYNSENGITVTVDNLAGTTTRSAGSITDNTSTSSKLKLYVEPAIRLGWMF